VRLAWTTSKPTHNGLGTAMMTILTGGVLLGLGALLAANRAKRVRSLATKTPEQESDCSFRRSGSRRQLRAYQECHAVLPHAVSRQSSQGSQSEINLLSCGFLRFSCWHAKWTDWCGRGITHLLNQSTGRKTQPSSHQFLANQTRDRFHGIVMSVFVNSRKRYSGDRFAGRTRWIP